MNEIIKIKGEISPETKERLTSVTVGSEEDLIRIAKIIDSPIIETEKGELLAIDGNKAIMYTFQKKEYG